ncbi:MAG: hypothetical protein QM780_14055 [Hyphomicrobium sp.]|uniref:hypothetical protein n=1 Tax=Hyphomicrobium sp. TaxID=82 RepID=UPI0039E61780
MEHSFWHNRWERGEIGFHQPHIHDQLQRFWPALALARGSKVFVPLCGKTSRHGLACRARPSGDRSGTIGIGSS